MIRCKLKLFNEDEIYVLTTLLLLLSVHRMCINLSGLPGHWQGLQHRAL